MSESLVNDDAEKITSELYDSNTLDTKPAQYRKRPYREYRCGTGQRPPKVKSEESSNNVREYEL